MFVADDGETECVGGAGIAVGDACTVEEGFVEAFEKGSGGHADSDILFEEVYGRTLTGVGGCRPCVFVETGEGRDVCAGKPKRTEGEHPFGVDDVADELADGPFARGVAVVELLFGEAAEGGKEVVATVFEGFEEVGRLGGGYVGGGFVYVS